MCTIFTDGSDEVGCLGVKSTICSSNEFKCGDGICIPIQWKCDMEQDCDSGDDEKSCKLDEKPVKRACADDEYQCKDGRCILVMKMNSLLKWNER